MSDCTDLAQTGCQHPHAVRSKPLDKLACGRHFFTKLEGHDVRLNLARIEHNILGFRQPPGQALGVFVILRQPPDVMIATELSRAERSEGSPGPSGQAVKTLLSTCGYSTLTCSWISMVRAMAVAMRM